MVRVKTLGSVLFLAIAACAGVAKDGNGKPVAKEKEDPRIVCRMERPTGSNIPERVCRYVELKTDEQTMRTQDMVRAAQGHADPTKGN
jgi:hypothetical protein